MSSPLLSLDTYHSKEGGIHFPYLKHKNGSLQNIIGNLQMFTGNLR